VAERACAVWVGQLIDMVDKNGDGIVDFEEFVDAFANVPAFTKALSEPQPEPEAA
jgi:Ca2+-binding EF-hand superfamily protein